MSNEASVSKRGGHLAGALHDVADLQDRRVGQTQTIIDSDPLDAFDALLPIFEETAASTLSRPPAGARRDGDPDDSRKAKPVSAQPIAQIVSQKLEGHSPAPLSAVDQVDLIESLRYWESELHRTEAELQQKADDLAARRRDLARQVRVFRKDSRRPTSSPDAQNQQATEAADNDSRLAEMQSQIEMLVSLLRDAWPATGPADPDGNAPNGLGEMHFGHDPEATARLDLATEKEATEKEAENVAEIESLRAQLDSLVEQNNQLATELAHLTVQRTVDQSSDATASMSWEERKELLYRQFESEDDGVPLNPEQLGGEQHVRLNHELACMQRELRARDSEIAELRSLLEQRPEVQDNDLAVGAAAITRLFDDDELIREERLRLKEIQTEWETKFRDMEIAASIERASLARERRQLECQNAELEEQLAHLKQELRQESIVGPAQTRRWFAKLGLGD